MVLFHAVVLILREIRKQKKLQILLSLYEGELPMRDLDVVQKVDVIAKLLKDVVKHVGIVDMLIEHIIDAI